MSLKTISAAKAKKLIGRGAVVVDIRQPAEFARERIPGAINEPAGKLGRLAVEGDGKVVIFHCKSGMRTRVNAERLKSATDREAYILEGGIDAWKAASLPVEQSAGAADAQDQAQLAAISIVFIGVALGMSVHPTFYTLAALAAAWLLYGLFRKRRA